VGEKARFGAFFRPGPGAIGAKIEQIAEWPSRSLGFSTVFSTGVEISGKRPKAHAVGLKDRVLTAAE
jgi:hypothetical protein